MGGFPCNFGTQLTVEGDGTNSVLPAQRHHTSTTAMAWRGRSGK